MTKTLNFENLPDAELVACVARPAAAQQEAAFEAIYRRYAREVLAMCGGIIWDDFDTARTVAQDALVIAYRDLSSGRLPAQPQKLRAWLLGIAKNRCREEFRRRATTGLMPDELPDDDWETASRRRRAEVDRILSVVATSLTGPQQRIYELSTRQGLRGQALAAALQTTQKEANDATYQNIKLLEEGFGAYILAREGRPFCPVLAGILDYSAWDGQTFSRVLRLRILKHLDTCPTCGNCGTCRDAKKRLIRPYAPALLPILCTSWLHDRVTEIIHARLTAQWSPPPPQPPAAGPHPPAPHARSGRARRMRLPATFGAAAIVPFVLALLITRTIVPGSGPPGPGAAAMPAIAYATGTSLVARHGTAPPQTLAAAPAGSVIRQLFWSADKHWLAWFSGPPHGAVTRVHITDVSTGTTHAWTCNDCNGAAFQSGRLLTTTSGSNVAMAFPAGGGNPATVTILPAGTNANRVSLLGTAPQTGTVLYVAVTPLQGQPDLFAYTPAGQARDLGQLPLNAVPGGDRNPGALGNIGISPDGKLLAYGGNILGGDTGEESDSVTVVNLITVSHTTVELPANGSQHLRISAIWIGSSDMVDAAAWPQPANVGASAVTVTPRAYRLQGAQWTKTGATEASGSGGQGGWTAVLSGNGSLTSIYPQWKGNLVVTSGQTRSSLATDVTAFAWAPPGRVPPGRVLAAATPVTSCPVPPGMGAPAGSQGPAAPPVPASTEIPPSITLPPGTTIFGTGLPGSSAVAYSLAPSGFTCSAIAGADGSFAISLGAPGSSNPSLTYDFSPGGAGLALDLTCPYIPAIRAADAVFRGGQPNCADPGADEITQVPTRAADLWAATVRVPPDVTDPNLPGSGNGRDQTLAVFLASLHSHPDPAIVQSGGQVADCALPAIEQAICVAGLQYFVTQSMAAPAGPTSVAAIQAAVTGQ